MMTDYTKLTQEIVDAIEHAVLRALRARLAELEQIEESIAEIVPPEHTAAASPRAEYIERQTTTVIPPRRHNMAEQSDYSILPEQLRAGAKRWIEQGIRPGSFLQAVMRNDLTDAVRHADDVSLACLRDIVRFFQTEAPRQCHGSEEWMQHWEEVFHQAATT